MGDEIEPAKMPNEDKATEPRPQDGPAESEVARGNVHSRKHDEPELPSPPPLPH